ncbi:hypothetical protein [Amycolatopsis taiwanensis]|uniref:Haloacid dehalogenase n=1 Tax=Amycolatopsis taiwanensis TaxID=342230 RepID=A0A9W6VFI2_9PSEU|nr:hypothetical protein [Amycolatopsis taiwanensis]GLY69638.1 hypothetical protein Atai01_62570 [Amycolatopsis taiwanensis]
MVARRLILFDVDGVLVERGRLVRPAGAAEGLARLRHQSDAVLSVATVDDKKIALRKLNAIGVDRYLDLEVGAYGPKPAEPSTLVDIARDRASAAYGCEFEVLAVTAGPAADVAWLRQAVDVLIALAPAGDEEPADGLREAGADHVVANLFDVADLVTSVPAN